METLLYIAVFLIVAGGAFFFINRSKQDSMTAGQVAMRTGVASHSFLLTVAGEDQNNADGSTRQAIIKRCRPGEEVELKRKPDLPNDPNAVAVLTRRGQIGYVPADKAAQLAQDIDAGQTFLAEIERVDGGTREKPNREVVLRLYVLE